MPWRTDRQVVNRAVRSDVSTVENTLDALDVSDVATGVAAWDVVTALVAIRDQGELFSPSPRARNPGLEAFPRGYRRSRDARARLI